MRRASGMIMSASGIGRAGKRGGERFFLISAIIMVFVIVAGFSLQLATGRSSFQAPPLLHAHAVVFMGWVAIFLVQNILIATGQVRFHRTLGWIAAAWMLPMLILGWLVTENMIHQARVPRVQSAHCRHEPDAGQPALRTHGPLVHDTAQRTHVGEGVAHQDIARGAAGKRVPPCREQRRRREGRKG